MEKSIAILGSTGSIGRSALDLISRHSDNFEVIALTAHSNLSLLEKQISEFNPKYVAVSEPDAYRRFRTQTNADYKIFGPDDGIEQLVDECRADIVLNAVVGAAGLKASLATVKTGRRLALANKESMVIGGPLLNDLADRYKAEIIPVDSEHSAIWQTLAAGKKNELQKIILTGSGGPFRELPLSEFGSITKDQALNHPNWKMGPKITIDSATMMNKGLEVIEAVHLFRVPPEKIEVMIHPQSIVHSMVEFVDAAIIAQLSHPDMRLPILYAFTYPDRLANEDGRIDLTEAADLTFSKPDFDKFRLLKEAFAVVETGGTAPAVFNAANEVAVDLFLNDKIDFMTIPDLVINTLDKHRPMNDPLLEDILEADRWAREKTNDLSGVYG